MEIRHENSFVTDRDTISPNVPLMDRVLEGADWVAIRRGQNGTQIPDTDLFVMVVDGQQFGDLLLFYRIEGHTIMYERLLRSPRR